MNFPFPQTFVICLLLGFIITGCSSTQPAVSPEDLEPAAITPDSLLSLMPDYKDELHTMTGTGRALISEPASSDRVTVEFQSNRHRSLLTIRTSVGIEGGQILVEPDSLLIYNKVDKIAQKVSPEQSTISSVGSIASLNMLDLFNFRIAADDIDRIFDDGSSYVVLLRNQAAVTISKADGVVEQVDQSASDPPAPYSSIEYEGYAEIQGFQLPQKITILSRDEQSRATFLVQQLYVNGKLPPLNIQIPEDIPIQRP